MSQTTDEKIKADSDASRTREPNEDLSDAEWEALQKPAIRRLIWRAKATKAVCQKACSRVGEKMRLDGMLDPDKQPLIVFLRTAEDYSDQALVTCYMTNIPNDRKIANASMFLGMGNSIRGHAFQAAESWNTSAEIKKTIVYMIDLLELIYRLSDEFAEVCLQNVLDADEKVRRIIKLSETGAAIEKDLAYKRAALAERVQNLSADAFQKVAVGLTALLDIVDGADTARDKSSQTSSKVAKEPFEFPTLSEDQIIEVEKICDTWNSDAKAYRGRVFEWVRKNLIEFVPGLTQGHLRANPRLYTAFRNRVRLEGVPADLDIPTDWEARARQVRELSPDALLARQRAVSRHRSKRYRDRHRS